MYNPYKNGTTVNIQDIEVNIPPKGYVFNQFTGKLEKRTILFSGKKKPNQCWERTPLPDNYNKKRQEEISKQENNKEYVDRELEAFRSQEWDRRINGVWFMNNGVPTYITGLHYFYMNWWRIDSGYPEYRDTDREFFYFTEYCIQDPFCLGVISVTKRREGKTYKGGVFTYDLPSRSRNKNSGIQSKTADDAKKIVFNKSVIIPFKHLPDFFRPTFDESKGLTPVSELRFFRTTVKGKKSLDILEEVDELESTIDWRSGERLAYDGYKLHRYLCDEAGKVEDVDVYDRHSVVKFCCMLDDKIIGKMMYTTTVEEMKSGGATFKDLWDDSDQTDRQPNGKTKSGLYRYFLPAYRTIKRDKYGVADEDVAKEYYLAERESVKHDTKKLLSELRKNPFTIEEAFMVDGDSCVFNAMILNERLQYLAVREEMKKYSSQRGNFEWETKEDGNVVFIPDKDGRFEVSWLFQDGGENNVIMKGGRFKPGNDHRFAAATDPVDHKVVVDNKRASKASALVFMKFDRNIDTDPEKADENGKNDWITHNFVCLYLSRPMDPTVYYEDMIKMCRYYGVSILAENQKIGVINWFDHRGYGDFIMYRPEETFTSGRTQDTPGIPASAPMINQYVSKLQTFISHHGHRVKFMRLIKEWIEFDPNNTKKFDAAVASGYALIAADAISKPQDIDADISNLLPIFDNTGKRSKVLNM